MSPRTPDSFPNPARAPSPRSPLAGRLPGLQAAGVFLTFDAPETPAEEEADRRRMEALDSVRRRHASAPSRMLPDEDWTDQLARSLTVDLDEEVDPLWPARLARFCGLGAFGLAIGTLAVVIGCALAFGVWSATS